MQELVDREGGQVPRIVEMCVQHIAAHGVQEPGIFRISGDKNQTDKLVDEFDK